eukprot:80097_1
MKSFISNCDCDEVCVNAADMKMIDEMHCRLLKNNLLDAVLMHARCALKLNQLHAAQDIILQLMAEDNQFNQNAPLLRNQTATKQQITTQTKYKFHSFWLFVHSFFLI